MANVGSGILNLRNFSINTLFGNLNRRSFYSTYSFYIIRKAKLGDGLKATIGGSPAQNSNTVKPFKRVRSLRLNIGWW